MESQNEKMLLLHTLTRIVRVVLAKKIIGQEWPKVSAPTCEVLEDRPEHQRWSDED